MRASQVEEVIGRKRAFGTSQGAEQSLLTVAQEVEERVMSIVSKCDTITYTMAFGIS